MTRRILVTVGAGLGLLTLGTVAALLPTEPAASTPGATTAWRTDAAWNQGKAEWALYDAERSIYGRPRSYEATIFTNTQHMDRTTGTKAENWRDANAIAVFKHNLSEIIPTDNYEYRFLTTGFVDRKTLEPFKVAVSTQEDCGSTYKEFRSQGESFLAREFCYFPGPAPVDASIPKQQGLAFHDLLSLRLRDFPFDASKKPTWTLQLVSDQTDTHRTPREPSPATVTWIGRETLDLPIGLVDAHHLRVTHVATGGTRTSDYWFAASNDWRHVMVQYTGPWGVQYRLKRLDWWAYWAEPRPS